MPRALFPFPGPLTDVDPSCAPRGWGIDNDWRRGVLDALDHGRDGEPRHIVVDVRSRSHAAQRVAAVTALADARGFLTLPAASVTWVEAGREVTRERTLLLIAPFDLLPVAAVQALIVACAHSARGHVLLTLSRAGGAGSVHEARARYTPRSAAPLRRVLPEDAEIVGLRERAHRAGVLALNGRHAAAERLLREVAAAFERRRRLDEGAGVLITLGRLLLERGRCDRADDAFERAATAARGADDDRLHVAARLWQANARIDAARLSDAESLCRAVMLLPEIDAHTRLQVHATLTRLLLLQRRVREAALLDLRCPSVPEADAGGMAFARSMRVRVLLAQERSFEAGVEARALVDDASSQPVQVRIVAEFAYLRWVVAVGDLSLAQACVSRIAVLARTARTPLRLARARALLTHALHRAGRTEAAGREVRRLRRMAPFVPPLFRRQIHELDASMRSGGLPRSRQPDTESPPVPELIAMAIDPDEDEEAVRQVLTRVSSVLRVLRIDVWSQDAGAASIVLSVGSGGVTRLGARALEAGIVLGPEPSPHGHELAVPVRRGKVLVAAIVARWAIDRPPPPDARECLETVAAIVCGRLESRAQSARLTARTATLIPELVGISSAMQEVRASIARAAAAPFAVLIQGESGVGKELVARAIHQLSARRERPFCDVNCAALPDDLLESELFGHARGAFTGAVVDRAGLFEAAAGGTAFLDEVADLSPRGQAKLLRVLQQQEVRRVGETFSRPIDVRFVAAANRELRDEVVAGRFRADLLYRLDVIHLRIPPLRERPEDVAPLALHLWRAAAARVETAAVLTHGVLSALSRYHWPGNVRELQNVMAALAVAAPGRGYVRPQLLPAAISGGSYVKASRLADARVQFERRAIESALARHSGNRSRAARELGLSRQGLLKMMSRLGVPGRLEAAESSDRGTGPDE